MVDKEQCRLLAEELLVPYPIAQILWQRGIRQRDAARRFLNPQLADLPAPFLMKDMDRAVALAVRAWEEQWPLCIHGDYDVDGISASALLARFFQQLGWENITCYQPDRLTEGYGLQERFIRDNAPDQGQRALLITVDCGISDNDEIELARKLGYRIIVTDHHLPGIDLPPADALLNPHQEGCLFPFRDLAGVGVAFFLVYGIRNHLVEQGKISREKAPNLKKLLDLVALGTVADVMPLTGLNRILVRAGLESINHPDCTWAEALQLQNGRYYNGTSTSEDISYRFAPRINAPGRLGRPDLSFQLLTSNDPAQCRKLAEEIEQINIQRRELESRVLEEVFAACEQQERDGAAAFVVYGRFHQGVIGIIASRAVDRFNKPVIVFTDDLSAENTIKGSGRSVDSVNLHETLQACTASIIQFGGHAMAAGLAVERDRLEYFSQLFNDAVKALKIREKEKPLLDIDYCPEPQEVLDGDFFQHYSNLQPFGNGNPEPVFLFNEVELNEASTVNNHLTYTLQTQGKKFRGIGFGMADKIDQVRNKRVRLAFKLKNTVYRGEKRIELHAQEVTPAA